MSLSNYPPGVTGNEYAIAGPDGDGIEVDIECPECGTEFTGTISTYKSTASYEEGTVCPKCGNALDDLDASGHLEPDYEPDPYPADVPLYWEGERL